MKDMTWELNDYRGANALFKRDLASFQRSTYIGWRGEAEKESLRLANEIGFPSKSYCDFRKIWDDYFFEASYSG